MEQSAPMSAATENPTRRRFSRLDLIVGLVSVTLIALVAVLAYLGSPERRGPAIAYLAPAYGGIQNVWLTPLNEPETAIQLTDVQRGIYNFGVSPDGRFIAYAEADLETGLNELKLLNLETRQVIQLTNCVAEDADCRTPVFSPDGTLLAYERMTINRSVDNLGPGALRIWLLDLRTQPYITRALADDSQIIGHSPQWSLDGRSIAFYSAELSNPGILVYNFAPEAGDKALKFVPSGQGTLGSLAPNGQTLVYPDIVSRPIQSGELSFEQIFTYLKIADLQALEFRNLTDPNGPTDDPSAAWNPDGKRLAIARRYTDERYTRGYQIYLYDVTADTWEPLVVDPRYSHGFFEWDRAGEEILFQRFELITETGESAPDARPEVWMKDLTTGELRRIAGDAFHPRWVQPG